MAEISAYDHTPEHLHRDAPPYTIPEGTLNVNCLIMLEWEREWYGVTTPNIISGQGVILFPFGATPPLIGEAEEVVAAEPLGAFNRYPNDLVVTVNP